MSLNRILPRAVAALPAAAASPLLARAGSSSAAAASSARLVAAAALHQRAHCVRFQSSSKSGGEEPISTEPLPEEPGSGKAAGDAGSAAGAAGERAGKLEAEVADLKKKLKEVNESRVYLLAEMENVRRIAKADVDKAKQYAAQPIVKSLLLAVDNLSMAVGSIPGEKRKEDRAFDNLATGVDATLKIFKKVLSEHGTVEFGAAGDKFDPNKHEAVSMVPASGGAAPNTVAHVLKTGFQFKDRVLRPAQVAVFMKAEAAEEAARAAEKVASESTRSL